MIVTCRLTVTERGPCVEVSLWLTLGLISGLRSHVAINREITND